jgi:hypothetical protein
MNPQQQNDVPMQPTDGQIAMQMAIGVATLAGTLLIGIAVGYFFGSRSVTVTCPTMPPAPPTA